MTDTEYDKHPLKNLISKNRLEGLKKDNNDRDAIATIFAGEAIFLIMLIVLIFFWGLDKIIQAFS